MTPGLELLHLDDFILSISLKTELSAQPVAEVTKITNSALHQERLAQLGSNVANVATRRYTFCAILWVIIIISIISIIIIIICGSSISSRFIIIFCNHEEKLTISYRK